MFGLGNVLSGLGGLLIGGLVIFGAQEIRLAKAVSDERSRGIEVCNARVAEITATLAADSAEKEALAANAAADLIPTPAEAAALAGLCQGDQACRDRKTP